ncbi:MAG TPA: hypothetical protein VM513_35775 [Kofleriaceae bacterium]|jgi:hypothetical protein|nr:hypothetical protein [Kofleriaceae bacterium]
MKATKTLLPLAFLLAPAAASAQGYYGGGGGGGYYSSPQAKLPGGFHDRQGRLIFGFSLGLGGMSDRFGDIECFDCEYSPIAAGVTGHIGGFIGPRLALVGELQGSAQTISSDRFTGDTYTLVQGSLVVAAQYWATPQLWLKGGVGFANLQVQRSYYGDGIVDEESIPENGLALVGGIGYELLSAQRFSVDLQGRLQHGSYKGIDNSVTAGTIGVGINWF